MWTYNNKVLVLLGLWCGVQVIVICAVLTPEQQRNHKINLLEAQRNQVHLKRALTSGEKQGQVTAINARIERIKNGEEDKPVVKAPSATAAGRPQFFAHQAVAHRTDSGFVSQTTPDMSGISEPSMTDEVSESISPVDDTGVNEQVTEQVSDATSMIDDASISDNPSVTEGETVSLEQVSAQPVVSEQSTSSGGALLKTGAAHEIAQQLADVARPAYLAGIAALETLITSGSQEISKNQVIELVKLALQPIKTSTQSKKVRSREQKDALRQMLIAGKTEAGKKNKADRVTYKGTPLSGATLGIATGSDLGFFNDAVSQLEKASLSRTLITDRIKPGLGLEKVLNEMYTIVTNGSTDFTKEDVVAFLKAVAHMNLERDAEKAAAVRVLKAAVDVTNLDEKLRPRYMDKPFSAGIAGIGGDRSDFKNWYEKASKKTLSRSLIVDNFALLGDRYEKAANYLMHIVRKGSEQYTKDDVMKMLEQAYEPIKNKRLKEQNEKEAALTLFTAAKEIVDEKDTKRRPKYRGEYLGQGINFNSRNIRSWYEAAVKYASQ